LDWKGGGTVSLATLVLHLTWLAPLLGALALAFLPAERIEKIRLWSAAIAALNVLFVLFLTVVFFQLEPTAQVGASKTATVTVLAFSTKWAWLPSLGAEYFVGVDAISLFLMDLAAIIVFAGTLASFRIEKKVKTYFILLQILASGTFGSFIAFDLLLFFFFNEMTLIPTFLLIGLFGSGKREAASMKLTLMLMLGSALVLLGFVGMVVQPGAHTFNVLELSQVSFKPSFQYWAFPSIFLGFALLGNLFPLHIWSPDGHAAAPTAISMFLAGVHMKIGSYGCLRFGQYLLPEGCHAWAVPFAILAVIGALWGALAALRQTDLKYLNAYSSVSHCALVFLGLCALNLSGLRGAVYQMLSHGFITATVFCVIGFIYDRTHTRDMQVMGGLMKVMPFLGIILILAAFAGIGLPGLSGFAAELPIFFGGLQSGSVTVQWATGLALFSIVLAAIYMLRGVNRILHGPYQSPVANLVDALPRERLALGVLVAGIFILGLYPAPWAHRLDDALTPILNQLQSSSPMTGR
jgi:NADH-quinone oxidoreductase subunit M